MPPLSRLARIQIAVLIIAGLVVSVFAGIRYVHLNRVVGVGIYTVDAHLPESGGIFTNAEVTYMGVPVGRVGTLTLRSDGVTVPLILESSGPDIPANSVAVVANRSAIGEQYVDLRPQSGSGPFLHDGSVITKTSVPPPIEDVVSSALDFTSSIPIDDLHTVITQLGAAFNGQADNLTRLVDSLGKLSRSGVDSLPQAISLINSADSVLATQAAQSDQILAWSRSLDLITATLASSDPDLRRLLTTGTTSATQISTLIQRNCGDIGKVVGQLSEVARTIAPAGYNIGNTFAMLSLLSAQGIRRRRVTVRSTSAWCWRPITRRRARRAMSRPTRCSRGFDVRSRPSTSTTTSSRSTQRRSAPCPSVTRRLPVAHNESQPPTPTLRSRGTRRRRGTPTSSTSIRSRSNSRV